MSRSSRAATPAGKRRSSGRAAGSRRRPSAAAKRVSGTRPAPKRTARTRKRKRTARPRGRIARAARTPRGACSWRYRVGLAAALVAVLAAGYMLWLRDSSLVAIDDVEVVGVTSGDPERIVAELTQVGEGMTTLHVDAGEIEEAAAAFPTIEAVTVDANFPHGLRIEVTERPPRSVVRGGGREVTAAADGTLLTGVPVPEEELPAIEVDEIPAAGSLGGEPLEQALVVGAVPDEIRPLIDQVDHSDDYGVEVTLRGDIPVRFGSASGAAEKWAAAMAVLADPELDVASYVDVRVPERPAVGGAAQALDTTDPQA